TLSPFFRELALFLLLRGFKGFFFSSLLCLSIRRHGSTLYTAKEALNGGRMPSGTPRGFARKHLDLDLGSVDGRAVVVLPGLFQHEIQVGLYESLEALGAVGEY